MMLALAGVAGIAGFAAFHSSRPKAGNEVEASQPAMNTAEVTAFGPTIPNKIAPPAAAPNGMVWIPGGEFSMGAMDPPAVNEFGMYEAVDARPIHRCYQRGVCPVCEGNEVRDYRGAGSDGGGIPRCATGESGCRLDCLFPPRIIPYR